MKKLALVIALAAAASWLLAERHAHVVPPPGRARAFADLDAGLGQVDATLRRDLERAGPEADGPDDVPTPVAPVPARPAPPPDGPIRTIPWRGGAASHARRAAPRDARAPVPATPAWFPSTPEDEEIAARPDRSGVRVLVGRLSASEDRARRDLDERLKREVRDWLAADVPPSWTPPPEAIKAMGVGSYVQPIAQVFKPIPGEPAPEAGKGPEGPSEEGLDDVYTLYRAGGRYDFSPARKAELVEIYRREVVDGRLHRLAGGVALALAALAVMVGYIRTDEATKGYYTNRLRLVAAAALGASGMAIYRMVVHS